MTKIESDIIWGLDILTILFLGMVLILGISVCVIGKQEKQRDEIIAESLIGKTIQSYTNDSNDFHLRFTDGTSTTFHAGKYIIHLK